MSISHPMIQEHTHDIRNIFTPTRMIRFSPAPQNKRHGVAVNFISPRQKLGISATKRHNSNKILQKLKNISVFILLLQNKGVTLQRNSKTTKQTLAVSHWPLAKQRKAINTIKTRGEMLKQVQHDSMHNVILNLVQDLSADKNKKGSRKT